MICPNLDCPHLQRVGEPAEFRAAITRCSDCGSELVETRPEQRTREPEEREYVELVPVLELPNAAVVSFVQSLMARTGIRFRIGGGLVGMPVATDPPVLFVEPSRAEEARELLAEVESEAPEDEPSAED